MGLAAGHESSVSQAMIHLLAEGAGGILFVLIGLEILLIHYRFDVLLLSLGIIPIVDFSVAVQGSTFSLVLKRLKIQ